MVEVEVNRDVVLDGSRIRYGKLHQAAYKRWDVSFKKELNEWGIRRVINDDKKILNSSLKFDETTLLILPQVVGLARVADENKTKAIIRNGSRIVLHPHYAPLDGSCVRIRRGSTIVADYYEQRNLIILYFNPFPLIPRTTYFHNALSLVREQIPDFQVVDNTEEVSKESLERNAKIFQKNITDSLKVIKRSIDYSRTSIEAAGKQIVKANRNIILETKKIEAVNMLEENFLPNFKRELESLEAQPYVKGVKISPAGIEVDVGEISIKHGEVNYYIGHIVLLITPEEVLVSNKNNARQGYPHPHTSTNGKSCFSSYQTDVSRLLAELKLTKLTFLMMQFLQSYNPGSPIHKIVFWRKKGSAKKATSRTTGRIRAVDNDVSSFAEAVANLRRSG